MNGVMASISSVLEKNSIGIESLIHREVSDSIARIAIITSIVDENALHESLKQLGALPAVISAPTEIEIFKS